MASLHPYKTYVTTEQGICEKMSNGTLRSILNKFPRGSGPLVSVIFPSRGRPKGLCEAIDSLYSLASNKKDIDFYIKADEDDIATIEIGKKLEAMLSLKLIVSPRGQGYFDTHHWMNQMAGMSKGDWIFPFNDDARMATQNWDKILGGYTYQNPDECGFLDATFGVEDIWMFICLTKNKPKGEFLLLRRKVYELLGHMSAQPCMDYWLISLMTMLNKQCFIPIEVKHLRETPEYFADQTAKDRSEPYLESHDEMRERVKDAVKLMNYLDEKLKTGS